jgi:hypothetical protein
MKNIYEMDLHETASDYKKGIRITRVPGGWIYTVCECTNIHQTADFGNSVFVSFSNEFQDGEIV